MDALLTSLLACFLAEMGDRTQLLAMVLALRYRKDTTVLAGIALGSAANAALSAFGGAFLSPLLTNNARSLFLALSLLFAGGGMLFLPVRPPDRLTDWRIGAFATSALGIFILGFGDTSQFMILGLSTRMADPVFTAIGGTIGCWLACLPAVVMKDSFFAQVPVRIIRRAGGGLLLLIGIMLALSAINLF